MDAEWMNTTGTDASTQNESDLGIRFRFRAAHCDDYLVMETRRYAFRSGDVHHVGQMILLFQLSTQLVVSKRGVAT